MKVLLCLLIFTLLFYPCMKTAKKTIIFLEDNTMKSSKCQYFNLYLDKNLNQNLTHFWTNEKFLFVPKLWFFLSTCEVFRVRPNLPIANISYKDFWLFNKEKTMKFVFAAFESQWTLVQGVFDVRSDQMHRNDHFTRTRLNVLVLISLVSSLLPTQLVLRLLLFCALLAFFFGILQSPGDFITNFREKR